ncbi:MAG: hypothetical protein ACJAVZ_002791 [Afipia broomeae]|jgi:hypothetical protein
MTGSTLSINVSTNAQEHAIERPESQIFTSTQTAA